MEKDRQPSSMEHVLGEEWVNVSQRRRSKAPFYIAAAAIIGLSVLPFLGAGSPAKNVAVQVQADNPTILTIDAPETGKTNEAFTITITAKSAGAVKTDYAGTVVFSSDDPNAVLPGVDKEYTFTSADAGVHQFPAAVKFTEAGTKSVKAVDKADATIAGEVTVEIQGGSGTTSANAPIITEPTDGQTVATPSVTIKGTAPASVEVKLTDNTLPLSTLTSDATGSFSYTAPNLTSGAHVLVATANGESSTPVNITVKTTATFQQPDLILTPNPATVGGQVSAQALADKSLKSVQVIIDQRTIELSEQPLGSGTYAGTFVAPAAAGSYPAVVHLEDDLGNKQDYPDLRVLTVVAGTPIPSSSPENQAPTVSFTFAPVNGKAPLTVQFSSEARDADGTIVAYKWEFGDGATSTEANPIHTYASTGKFFPKLTVTDNGGKSAAAVAARPVESGPWGTALLLLAAAGIAYGVRKFHAR